MHVVEQIIIVTV